jgi:hypothetical protein
MLIPQTRINEIVNANPGSADIQCLCASLFSSITKIHRLQAEREVAVMASEMLASGEIPPRYCMQ